MKKSWWKLIITDYPNFDPNDADLEHIAELIKQGYHQGQLIQEEEKNKREGGPTGSKLQALKRTQFRNRIKIESEEI